MDYLISFIIPVYKVEEKYLRECIESLLKISVSNIEFVLVEDGSPDNNGIICDEYAAVDERIQVIHKNHEGVSAARNKGIYISKGKYITFIDSDDWIDSQKIEKILKFINKNNYDLIIYGYYDNYKDNEIIRIPKFDNKITFTENEEFIELKKMVFMREYGSLKEGKSGGILCNTVDKIIKRDLLINNNIRFDTEIAISEDALFNLEMLFHCKSAYYIDIYAYHYRKRRTSAGKSRNFIGLEKSIIPFYSKAKDILDKYQAPEILYTSLYYRCFDLISEQLDNVFLYNKNNKLSLYQRSQLFSQIISFEPFVISIQKVRLNNLGIKRRIMAILLKNNLSILFLLLKDFLQILHKNKNDKYY